MSKVTTKKFGDDFEKRVAKMFKKMGFDVERNPGEGPDITAIIKIQNRIIKIVIQCKRHGLEKKEEIKTYTALQNLIDEYSTKRKKSGAAAAVIALSGYKAPQGLNLKKALNQERVAVWTDKFIGYYEKLQKKIGEFAKYQLLADLAIHKNFGEKKKLRAVSLNQNGYPFFVFAVEPEWLLKSSYVLRRVDPAAEPKSYQRILNKKRVTEEIPSFYNSGEWVLPNNIICATRSDLNIKFESGKLILPSEIGSLWVMDGQHRLYGFANTDEGIRTSSKVLCALFDSRKMGIEADSKQARIFIEVNLHAKKVPTSLLAELETLLGTKKASLGVALKLKDHKIFKGKVKSYTEGRGVISLVTLAYNEGMRELTKDDGLILKNYKPTGTEDEVYQKKVKKCFEVFRKYFEIINKVDPEVLNEEKYAFISDKGIRGLFKLLVRIIKFSEGKFDEDVVENAVRVLAHHKGLFTRESFKSKYAGEAGATDLANEWSRLINKELSGFDKSVEQKVIDKFSVKRGDKENTKRQLEQWLKQLSGNVRGILMHIDPTTIGYLEKIPTDTKIRIFFGKVQKEEEVKQRLKELRKKGFNIVLTQAEKVSMGEVVGSFFHDRWLGNDEKRIKLETDLKYNGIANAEHTKYLESWKNPTELLKFEKYWDLAERGMRFKFDWK